MALCLFLQWLPAPTRAEGALIIQPPVSQEAAVGETVCFSVETQGEQTAYQWEVGVLSDPQLDRRDAPAQAYAWSTLPGEQQADCQVLCTEESLRLWAYRCVVTDGQIQQATEPVWISPRPTAAPRNGAGVILGGDVNGELWLLERLGSCAMQGDGCVKLTQSAAVANHSLAVTGGEMILDLNGYTLTGQGIAPITVQGGSLTVIDSVGGGGLVGGAGAPALSVSQGALSWRSGALQGGSTAPGLLLEGSASVRISGGSAAGGAAASGKGGSGLRIALGSGSCAISGGQFLAGSGSGSAAGLELIGSAQVVLTGGQFEGYDGSASGRALKSLLAAGYGFLWRGQPMDSSAMEEVALRGELSVVRVQQESVYLDGTCPDGGDGQTPQTAVNTFARAYERVAPGGVIHLVGPVTVADNQEWRLPEGVKVSVEQAGSVVASGSLNLEQIEFAGGQAPVLRIEGGQVALGAGAVIHGHENAAGAAVYMEGGALTLAGGSVTGGRGVGIQISGGDLVLSGGEITDNEAGDVRATGPIGLGGAGTIGRLSLDGDAALTITASLAGAQIGIAPGQMSNGALIALGVGYLLQPADVQALSLGADSSWSLTLDTAANAIRLGYPKADRVYLDGGAPAGGDGSSPQRAVNTFAAAKERLGMNGEICITGTVSVNQDETWSLPASSFGDARVVREASFTEAPMIRVQDNRLTLHQIILDGAGVGARAPGIDVSPGGDLVVADALLENHAAGAVCNRGRTVITGGTLRNSPGARGGLDNAGELRLNGATLTDSLYTAGLVVLSDSAIPEVALEADGEIALAGPLTDAMGIRLVADARAGRVVVQGDGSYAPSQADVAQLTCLEVDWQLVLSQGRVVLQPLSCPVTYRLTGLTISHRPASAPYGQRLELTLTAEDGARLPESVDVTQDGQPATYRYDPETGALTIPKVTGALVISAQARVAHPIHTRIQGGGSLGVLEEAFAGDLVIVAVIADAGSYLAPDSLRVNGQPLTYLDEGIYSFTMPERAVELTAAFAPYQIPTLRITQNLPERRAVEAGERVRWQIAHETPDMAGWVSYQWFRNGAALPGEQGDSLTLRTARPEDAGAYHVEITYHLNGQWTRTVSQVCELAVAQEPGDIQLYAEAPSGTPMPQVADLDALAEAALSSEELALVERGEKIALRLAVRQLPEGSYRSQLESALMPGEHLGMVLDLQLYKQVAGGSQIAVPQMRAPVRVTLELSDELRLLAAGQPFALLRIHEGQVERLPNLDAHSRRYTFLTDRFSTYALIYGQAEPTATPGQTPEPTPPSEAPAETPPDAVPTGVDSLIPAALLMAMSAGGLSLTLRRRKPR